MKKLNKTFLLTASLLVVCRSAVFGQQVSYTLSQPINSSASFNARDYFRLLPGFSFDPSPGGKTLHLGIDEHILGHATYQSKLQIPNPNRSLNTSYAVGSIVGDVSVSPTGAAVYQIDIDVIPGTAGVQPAISVVYNSQSGNGVVGYGWSLSATSAITRTGSTLYHDNAVRAPNLTTSDNLLLDGQRLMLASGSNLSLSSTYQTEIESYNTITYKYLNSLLSFEVKTTDGWTLQYGSSFDSNIMAAGSSEAHSWLLKKVTDANGNYMTYSYENNTTTGEYRIKQIDYTGNTAAGLVPYNKIEFLYEIRTDSTTHYIENKQIKQRLLIKRIKCSTYGSVVREYKFNYYYDGFFSKLTEVEAYGLDGIRYNSTVVDWGDYGNFNAKTGNEYLSPFSESIGLDHLIYEDFNNDGKTDILSYSPTESISLFLANTAITGGIHFVKQCTIPLGVNFVGMIPAELNGDGLMDVIRVNSSGSSYHYTYYIYNGASFAAMPAPGLSYTFSSSSPPSDVFVGDFNGDGKDEVLVKSGTKLYGENGAEIASGGIGNWGTSYVSSGWLSGLIAERVKVSRRLIDFNGNGKANLLVMGATGFIIYELNDSGTAFYTLYSGPELLCITAGMNKIPLFGDFNGDGKTDILVCKYSTPNEYYILYSTGTEFKKKILPNLNVSGKWFAADFNRDGRSDIIFSPAIGSVCIGLFDGETFQFESHNITLLSGYNLDSNWEKLNFSDFDGDGYPELCYELFSSSFSLKSFTSKQNLFVRTIVNGLNHKSAFTYHPITDNSVSGKSSLAVSYPVSHFCQPLYVVSSWTQQLGNLSETLSYHYKGGKIHRQGKGFLGFDEVTVTNTLQNRKALTQYSYNPIFYHVYPTKQTVTTVAGDSITRTNFQPGLYTTATKVIFPYIAKQTTVDKLTGMSNTVDYVYSAADHGNPSAITKTQGSLTMQMLYTWEAKGGSVYKNRVTQQQTTRQGIGPPFSQIQTFTYDGLARLTQQVDFAGNAKAITTAYTNYDHFGNLKTVTTTAANCPTITTSSIFDATGRFVTSQTDELGKTSYAQYDPKTGVLLEQTDIAGLKTTYLYDGFQQLKQSESPFDKLTYSNSWSISGNNLYTTTATSLVTGSQTILYNAAGQELRTQSPGFSGTVVAENTYNAKGQLYRSYLPGYGNSSPQYIEYDYDTFGRLLSETNIGRTTTYSYNGLTTTVTTPNGKTRATTLNLSGLVAGTTDEAGTAVTYTYNSLGKPVIISAAGDITQITYDDRGFQQSLKDVNIANPIQYVYNAYGQIASQTNEQGQTTTYLYDVAGRLTNQTAPERTLTYQYVPSGYGVGQIQTILENNSTVRSYAYTPFGQVASIAEKIDGIDYTTGYTYNSYGQLTEKQSPSGMRVGYQYNNGLLTTMRNAETNTLLWQANAINALGQVTTGTLGNGLQRVMGYDTYHLPNQIALKDGSTIIDQIDYGYNPVTINLTSRNDISTGRNELFGYDALNRLDSLRINSGILSRMTYYPNGNINTKFNVGTYHYAYSNHAVTGIVGPVSGYTFPTFTLSRTSYNRPSSLLLSVSPAKKIDFVYNPDNQRCKTLYYENNVLQKTMNYVGNYEKEVIEGGETNEYDYIYSPEGLAAIAVKTGSTRTLYYAHLDHLGSLRVLTADNKSITSRYHYDAWGLRTLVAGANITNRGFTGHEHLPEFGFINMNARLYDPVIGRFLAMDPYVQMPDYTQAFNRYSYSMNNPLIYTDPSGEKWWHWLLGDVLTGGLFSSSALITSSVVAGTVAGTGAAVYATTFPFSNDFYELQKFISPIAIKPPSFHFGSDQTGFGFDISAGFPTSAAPGARYHFGATYHINSYGGYQGWETRSGLETRMLPLVSYSYTKFRAGEFTQTTGMFRTGPPFAQLSYENDYMFFFWGADKGDRWRTAAVQMNAGLFSFYLNMFTGDPDSFSIGDRERNVKMINGHLTYTGGSADKYRAGVLSLGFGPIRVGRNSEEIRKVFQNQFAHDILTGGDAKWFRVLDIMPRWYWYFGFGTGNSLW